MNVATIHHHGTSFRQALAAALRRWPAKLIANRVDVSTRTAEAWRAARTTPEAEKLVALMCDPQLGPSMLQACGLADVAQTKEALAKLQAARDLLDEIAR
jgi:cobalamin biosynthesis Mg chelatase CobN